MVWRGFSTADQPSFLETMVSRTARNFSIPRKARLEANPWQATDEVLKEAREKFAYERKNLREDITSKQAQIKKLRQS